jgi:predicted nucleic acid-binding protein
LIAYLKGRQPGAASVQRAVRDYACFVSSITVYELLFGVARASKRIGEEELLGVMQVLPLDNAAARRAATLHDELVRANQEIGIKDVLIAAICLTHAMPLLSLNTRHFSRVPGLAVETAESFLRAAN